MCIYTTLCDLLSTHTDSPDSDPTTSPDNINPTTASPDILLILLPVLAVVLLLSLLITCTIILLVRRRFKITQADKDISTSPNVSYGAHPPSVTVLEDPLYESIHNQQLYEVACPPDDLTEYYVNEGLGPN